MPQTRRAILSRSSTLSSCVEQANGHYSSAASGYSNRAFGYGSTIGGGHQNTVGSASDADVGDMAIATGAFGFVGAGWGNLVGDPRAWCGVRVWPRGPHIDCSLLHGSRPSDTTQTLLVAMSTTLEVTVRLFRAVSRTLPMGPTHL